jgi:hypothetical protein
VQEQYLLNTMRSTGAQITGIDPVTGLPTYGAQSDKTKAAAKLTAAAKTAKQKKAAARATAVAKRNDATVAAVTDATDWVESTMKPGTQAVPTGEGVPIKAYIKKAVVKGKPDVQWYVKKGGGYTKKVDEAATKPVYQTVPIPKAQYRDLRRKLISRLGGQLRMYGYKPVAIARMADELLDDYYTQTQMLNPEGNRTTNVPGRPDRRGGV